MDQGHYVQAPDSRESSAIPFSQEPNPLEKASLPSVVFAQWIQPMISLGSRRVLEIEDMWPVCPSDESESLEKRFHRVYEPHRKYIFGLSPVFMAYVKVFQADLAVVLAGCIVYVLALGLQTYVTRALLEFLNGEENVFHISSGYWLMVMMTGSSLVAVCVLNYLFFIDSRIGSNMRTLTMSLVYNKALRLSSSARQDYTTGEILTLMSVDTERVFTAMVQGPWLVMGPLAFVVSCVLIGFLFDFYAALAGAIVLTTVMVISVQQGDRIADLQKRLLRVIDERVKVTSETLQGIRVMKFYAWEESLAQRVENLRVKEVSLLRKFHSYQVINTVMLFITPTFLSGATLGVYVLIRHTITVVEAFTLVAIVNISRAPLNQLPQAVAGLSKAKIAYARIDAFLASSEVPMKTALLSTPTKAIPSNKEPLLAAHGTSEGAAVGPGHISIRDGAFEWPTNLTGRDIVVVTPAEENECLEKAVSTVSGTPGADMLAAPSSPSSAISSNQGFQLEGVNLEIERGALVMVVGRVGAGKSSLVNAILGEMPRTSGVLEIGGRVAYVSQDTWIRNATLRGNILFEQDYDPERGGQKARVAIARAMYRKGTDVLILDDPLSAVDPHVAHAIFDKCIVGMAGDQTRLLVLNSHYDLLPSADHIVVMRDGVIAYQGSYNDVLAQFPQLTMDLVSIGGDGNDELVRVPEFSAAVEAEAPTSSEDKPKEADAVQETEENERNTSGRLIRAEDRVKGKVSGRVYKTYFDETGFNGIVVIVVIIAAYIAGQAARTVVDWWPGHWARNMPRRGLDPTYSSTTFGMWYLGFIVLCSVLSFGRALMMIESCVRSSQHMHDDLFRRVLRAPVTRYFDVTPMGQILNRFSNDLDQMDTMLPQEYQLLLQNVSLALGALAVSAFASYWIALTYIPIFGIFLFIGQYFKKTSSEIKRLEGVTRTPVYNLFSETLSGLATIRAFRMEGNFIKQNRRVVDSNSNLYFTYWAASRWLATRLDLLSVLIIFVVTLYLVATVGSVGSLTSGLSLTYSLMLTSMVQWVMRSVDRTDNAMTSVERLLYFRQIESEVDTGKTVAELLTEEKQSMGTAPRSWPSRGSIRFDQLCLRYRPELPLVLKGVDMDVAAAGLDFEVAEGGDNLSVGQRQLICIGRALLKDSKVVVLDEATANVDTATDALIQATIKETFQDKTVLIIAHRINTIMHCDKIAVMDAGRVVEFDSPSMLLAQPQSVFAALAKKSGTA
ncbi:hypothetical protein PC110_g5817 [Phytophthora cactorum]|uniref:Uncharacterized protein n=1 Tax=Phytophthora cactorum TaxID=29920 RepID=A0A329SMA3_9STRA|nr:hypothetical protein PC110_g5817 [Phytophthora cactorum]